MEAILLVVVVILLVGFLGGNVAIRNGKDKEINLNDLLNKGIDKIKDFFNKDE